MKVQWMLDGNRFPFPWPNFGCFTTVADVILQNGDIITDEGGRPLYMITGRHFSQDSAGDMTVTFHLAGLEDDEDDDESA